tara:strand:+ start:1016 stop:1204 length:189 start_codon:yes stop_codon:yes gene_type:complete
MLHYSIQRGDIMQTNKEILERIGGACQHCKSDEGYIMVGNSIIEDNFCMGCGTQLELKQTKE